MARKVIGPTGSRRRYWLLLLCLALTAGLAVVFIPAAGADSVKAQTFELDGNVAQNGAPATYDWANFFNSSGSAITPEPSGYGASTFVKDFKTKASGAFDTSDASTFTVGSKDIQNVSGWSCTPANNVTDKGDIMNAYALTYTASDGHKIVYFGLERNANAGDANVAFWFLQGSASCPSAGGSFVGDHHNGDLLIVSAFTNGGSVSTIDAYVWQGGATGSLNTTPVAHGVDCRTASASADPTCATSNTAAISSIPWLTENKSDGVGHSLQSGEFFEGGIDLTPIGLANDCFNTFMADTRSSQSLTATLYDYALGNLGECHTNLSTQSGDTSDTPENNGTPAANPTSIGGGSVSSGTDTAALQVTGISSWSGTLSFYLCGPFAGIPSGSGPKCDNTGVPEGSVNVSESDNNVHNFVSGAATLTAAGTYCWTAHFEPSTVSSGNGVGAQDDNGSHECFTVGQVTPSIQTCSGSFDQNGVCTPSAAVAFGNAVNDSALVSNLATEPGNNGASNGGVAKYSSIDATNGAYAGSIQFTLDHAGTTACGSAATGTGNNPQSTPSSGSGSVASIGNGLYGPVSFTPDAPGDYYWLATLSNASSVNNVLPQSDDTGCNENSEKVTVQQIPTSISTAQKVYPQDSATISSTGPSADTLPAGGTVTFYLYDGLSDCQAHGTSLGSGGLLYKEAVPTNSTAAHSETFGTNNSTVAVNASTTVYWRVTYATGDTAHTGRQSDCAESTQTTFSNDSGPGTLFP